MLGACGATTPKPPYPAFVAVGELPDVFMAELPGIRAKQFGGDATQRTGKNRVDLPPSWQGSSSASPGKTVEIFVLDGELLIGDVKLGPGGYAYLPSGTLGFNMSTSGGARILYYLENVDAAAVIRTPLILDSTILPWQPGGVAGVEVRELRLDPGSGARTWLERVAPGEPGTTPAWRRTNTEFQQSECIDGKVVTGRYRPGGYFSRPPGVLWGGPETYAVARSTWFLRRPAAARVQVAPDCVATSTFDD